MLAGMTTVLTGDARSVRRTLRESSFRCCVTSPPYWEQREYLPKDHPKKALEIGHEPTPRAYISELVKVFREVRRVLADDGTLWLNLGDKYTQLSGQMPGGHHFGAYNRLVARGAIPRKLRAGRVDLPKKSLIGLPWRVAFALQDDGWVLRSEIIWEKPNAQPSSVLDRPTTAHEHLFLFAKSPHYFYDADAIREPHQTPNAKRRKSHHSPRELPGQPPQTWTGSGYHALGRNARSVWCIATTPGDGEHVAPMPRELARRCILAGSAFGDAVLDPFGGSGTVGKVGSEEGRAVTLIDLDERAIEMANARTVQLGFTGS